MEWFFNNYEWFFSGLGIFLIGVIYHLLKSKNQTEKSVTNKNPNFSKNRLNAKKIDFKQTIINNGAIPENESPKEPSGSINLDPEILNIKEEYFGRKNEFRTYLIKKLAKAYGKNSMLELRHITDTIEDERKIPQLNSYHELTKLEDEGLIRFLVESGEVITPYTRIKLTERFFKMWDK
ncbi:hypothetical protein [Algoriphagus persicinus]|uniref:hypothetical protein n=1 Tax=Algoriphagus persicinus TaxID=3108754 RepID=UPI002B3E08AC|nr:hypothetical protein [Algoriphagus sp. E1-3-M2]MEB2783372.1 hypothetical protein [Algoriphagus sp. E1-3-M2]